MLAYELADNLIELQFWSMQKFRPEIDILTMNCRKKLLQYSTFKDLVLFPGEFNMYSGAVCHSCAGNMLSYSK